MKLTLVKLLQSQGFGSRRDCEHLVKTGRVRIEGQCVTDGTSRFSVDQLTFSVDDQTLSYRQKCYLALYKPAGFECSHQPQYHQSVYSLLPHYIRNRQVQAVGRLDQDTTGLLLLSDDGQFIHRLTHPRRHVAKYYCVTTSQPITTEQCDDLARGVQLHGETDCFKAFEIEQLEEFKIRFAIDQGIYHQVKRMMAAVGQHVVSLHRDQIAQLHLDHLNLDIGQWQQLEIQHLALLMSRAHSHES